MGTYVESVEVDGRARRLYGHTRFKVSDRNVSTYIVVPINSAGAKTCLQQFHDILCRQNEFFTQLETILFNISLSVDAIRDFGNDTPLDEIRAQKQNRKSAGGDADWDDIRQKSGVTSIRDA